MLSPAATKHAVVTVTMPVLHLFDLLMLLDASRGHEAWTSEIDELYTALHRASSQEAK